jgi:hypothetical protein
MNERIKELSDIAYKNHLARNPNSSFGRRTDYDREFAELILKDMHKKVIASILVTDVVMEDLGLKPTSEDYIRAINKDFGVE